MSDDDDDDDDDGDHGDHGDGDNDAEEKEHCGTAVTAAGRGRSVHFQSLCLLSMIKALQCDIPARCPRKFDVAGSLPHKRSIGILTHCLQWRPTSSQWLAGS